VPSGEQRQLAHSAAARAAISPRSDPRQRRRWLRNLDSLLAGELEEAGALSCAELTDLAAEPLRGHASSATIEEWWEFAYRRGFLEEVGGGRCRLSASGRAEVRAARQRDAGLDQAALGRSILKWLLPASAVGVTAYLSGRHPGATVTIVAIAVGVAIGLILLAPLMRRFDRAVDQRFARHACDWLEDRPMAVVRDCASRALPATRLYSEADRVAPGLSGV
jgi:hypothetical protein